ncbi:MAG: hypothetical protein H6741_09975 [Alphaproteobacteria bacterium]|nr:hypothetical protein [Alphaproteobacteria bacterium]MCB9758212.1 hypothetical protein [Alphaproteobacteria bacterium]MCB9793040.1 hypothetical protein [Alphaproteobacteria bacterium]
MLLLPLLLACSSPAPVVALSEAQASGVGPQPSCHFAEGQRLSYSLDARVELAGTTGPSEPAQRAEQRSSATLDLRVLEAEEGQPALVEWTTRVLSPELEPPHRALVRVDARCGFLDYGFPEQALPTERVELVELTRTLQFLGAEAATPTGWVATQWSDGAELPMAYQAERTPEGETLLRRRVAGGVDPAELPQVHTEASAWVRPGEPWLARLSATRSHHNQSFGADLDVREHVELERLYDPEHALPAPLSPEAVRWVGQRPAPEVKNRRYDLDKVDPATLALPVEALAQALAGPLDAATLGERNAARLALVAYLRAHRERAQAMLPALEAAGASRRSLDWATLALSDVGSPQAEAALLTRVQSVLAEEPHALVLHMVSRQVTPGQASVEALEHLAFSSSVDPRLQNQAHLALGTLVGRGRLPLALEGRARTRLLDALLEAEGSSAQAQALVALGNTRDPSLAPSVRAFVNAEAPIVRAQAWRTLVQLGAGVHPRELLEAMREDERGTLRGMVTESLLAKTLTPDAEDRRYAWALIESSPEDYELRSAAIQVLGRVAPRRPSTRARLADWFHQEPVARLKALIGRYVSAEALRAARPTP